MGEARSERDIRIVEADFDLHDPGVRTSRGVGTEDVLLADAHRDAVDDTVEGARERRARHLCLGTDRDLADARFLDLGDRIHGPGLA